MSKIRYALLILLALCLPFLLQACAKKDSRYNDEKRAELMRESVFVARATYKETQRLKEGKHIDVVDARPGYSDKMEHLVVFKIKDFLKGSYGKSEIGAGVNLPSLAFGITPDEFAGEKTYTLYVGYSPKHKRNALIGAEWEKIKYTA